MGLDFRTDYWQDHAARAEFQAFIRRIHGLDFTAWERAGYWDRLYRPFSFFDGDRLVASTCLYSMDMVVAGARRRVAQISGVGTLPEFRRQGLNRRLTELALEWARPEHDFVFLFADEEAFPFYAATGFRPVQEHFPRLRAPGGGSGEVPGLRRLDMELEEDRALVHRLGAARTPVSARLGVLNLELLMFHALYPLREHLHHLPERELIVAFERDEEGLRLFDLVGSDLPPLPELLPELGARPGEPVDLLFLPDRMHAGEPDWLPLEGNGTHLMGDFPLEGEPFLFPFTAHA